MNISKMTYAVMLAMVFNSALADEKEASKSMLERGHYVVATSGCNDCHTPGYAESGGTLPTREWLTGAPIGFQGPWGTTYPANLRLSVFAQSEKEWLARARQPMRPPMPWFSLREMNDSDLKAVYYFIRSLGPRGEPAPAYAQPGQTVSTPYIEFVPKNLPTETAAKVQ